MSKQKIFDAITSDTVSDPIESAPGEAGLFVQIAPIGHGRVVVHSSADGGISWVPCKTEHGEEAVFNGNCFCALQEHGGNTLMRFTADQTSGSTTGITVYLTTKD